MERLTVNDLNKVCYDPWELCGMDNYCKKGCHEEGGCTKGCHILKMYRKLAEYEDLEEQGKLLKLLCGVGAELWAITTIKSYSLGLPKKEFLEHPQKKRVESITLSRNGILYHARGRAFHDYHFGKEVFFTEKEAEAALKELERGKGE